LVGMWNTGAKLLLIESDMDEGVNLVRVNSKVIDHVNCDFINFNYEKIRT